MAAAASCSAFGRATATEERLRGGKTAAIFPEVTPGLPSPHHFEAPTHPSSGFCLPCARTRTPLEPRGRWHRGQGEELGVQGVQGTPWGSPGFSGFFFLSFRGFFPGFLWLFFWLLWLSLETPAGGFGLAAPLRLAASSVSGPGGSSPAWKPPVFPRAASSSSALLLFRASSFCEDEFGASFLPPRSPLAPVGRALGSRCGALGCCPWVWGCKGAGFCFGGAAPSVGLCPTTRGSLGCRGGGCVLGRRLRFFPWTFQGRSSPESCS